MIYKNVSIQENAGAITKETISSFESEFKVKLPEDYKQFLLATNGGEVGEQKVFWVKKSKVGKTKVAGKLGTFFGLTDDPYVSLGEYATNYSSLSEDLNCKIIVIGMDIGEDTDCQLLLLRLDGEHQGKVYLCYYEDIGFPEFKFEDKLIATTFDELLNQIQGIPKQNKIQIQCRNYLGIEFNSDRKLVEEKKIQEFEKSMNITFPQEYREFLLAVNGGSPNLNRLSFNQNKKDGSVDKVSGSIRYMFSLKHEDLNKSFTAHNKDEYPDKIQKWLKARFLILAIIDGYTNNGGYLLLGLDQDIYGKLYYASCGEDERKYFKAPKLESIKIADSFNEFLKMLR